MGQQEEKDAGLAAYLTNSPTGKLSTAELIDRYYRFLAPQESNDNYVLNYIDDGGSVSPERKVIESYIGSIPKSGIKIIEDLRVPDEADQPPKGYGLLYNTMHHGKQEGKTRYLDEAYWAPSYNSTTAPPVDSKTGSVFPVNPAGDFFKEVVGGEGAAPPVDFTINVLRGPIVNEARRNTIEIETFLNHMPSIFPSQMVPYFDIEFQFAVDAIPWDKGYAETSTLYQLQRPSLFRFLMGSQVQLFDSKNPNAGGLLLTAADLNLSFPVPLKPKTKVVLTPEDYSYFAGMELFTAPQALSNMDKLGAAAGSRLQSVQPFLPPASLIAAQVSMMNAGAGSFIHKKAEVTMKIHDKARLVEFSEFLRSAEGYRGLTVWLTYGWLAPRGRGEDDIYAKFINENMLHREAFMIKNNSFSFDAQGQVEVKLDMVSKGYKSIESETIDIGNPKKSVFGRLSALLDRIKKNRKAFGSAPEGAGTDVRIYQILDSATSGNLDIDVPGPELVTVLRSAKETLANKKGISDKDRAAALELLGDVESLYAKKPDSTGGGGKEVTQQSLVVKKDIINYNKKRFDQCTNIQSPDPFLPDPRKVVGSNKVFSGELIKSMNDQSGPTAAEYQKSYKKPVGKGSASSSTRQATGAPQKIDTNRTLVSFGKLFSVFCMPSLLRSAEIEGLDEVQVSFYQFNDSCGPLSLHSIAEFPINIDDFQQQFSEMVYQRGGEAMTVQEFMNFVCNSQFSDSRSPGFGMRSYYEPYDVNKPQETKSADEATFNGKMSEWIAKWGGFRKPNVAIKMETVATRPAGKVDLLYKLQRNVGINPEPETPTIAGEDPVKKIKKISIYDKQYTPHSKISQIVRDSEGTFASYEGKPAQDFIDARSKTFKENPGTIEELERLFFKNVTRVPIKRVTSGRNILKDFIKDTVPTLTIGTNGTLIYNVKLASKTDGLLGTVNLQGGAYRSKATMAPNGLSMGEYSLPMRVVPASMTMSSLGCPIADVYQQYFIDFGTGTTIDNLYTVTQLNHNFTPGKFETNWTFTYTDGYGRFYGAPKLEEMLKDFVSSTNERPAAPTAPTTPAASTAPVASAATPSGPTKK